MCAKRKAKYNTLINITLHIIMIKYSIVVMCVRGSRRAFKYIRKTSANVNKTQMSLVNLLYDCYCTMGAQCVCAHVYVMYSLYMYIFYGLRVLVVIRCFPLFVYLLFFLIFTRHHRCQPFLSLPPSDSSKHFFSFKTV